MNEVTTIPAIDFRALALEVQRQPELFSDLEGSVAEMEIVRAARERRYDGSGTPGARAAQIVALRVAGASLCEIRRRLGADPRTVSAVIRAAEEQGIVPTIKEVVSRRMAELTEKTMTALDRELDSPTPDAQLVKSLWVGTGIGADKLGAAAAPAPQLHLHAHVGPSDQDPAAVYARMLRTQDAESAVSATTSFSSKAPCTLDTVVDVSEVSAPESGEVGQAAAEAGGAAGFEGGAGGGAIPAAPAGGDGKP